MNMRILYYNWVQFDDYEKRGGGVTIYQKNLIECLKSEHSIYFISSGLSYSFRKKTYIRRTKNIYKGKCRSFEIVNSPIISPALCAFKSMNIYLEDTSLLEIFMEFIKKYGPFDVIHFNNFEGLSINVLKIKEYFPNTKIVFSIHNYFLFCPQVNLWRDETENCLSCSMGRNCCTCVDDYYTSERTVRNYYMMEYYLKKIKVIPGSIVWEKSHILIPKYYMALKKLRKRNGESGWNVISSASDSRLYYDFQKKNIEYANEYVDVFLAVSNRVKEIAVNKGISKDKIQTSYIGTKFADLYSKPIIGRNNSSELNVCFIGYARRDKGFFFLLKAFKVIPKEIASHINLFFAVRTDDKSIVKAMQQLGNKFNSVYVKNGYDHSELENMLSNIDLGLVPVLWEDNMPQVAIELVSYGIPVLSSNLGGAQELANNPLFVFKANDIEDFLEHIKIFAVNKTELLQFWKSKVHLVTMAEHIKELELIYKKQ